ncbi:TlpA disulfide reductase family protein [uncultured Granulicatella sp.]|uniref:TlpA family protein disulfide reductase n=1 Tax=uncultured Granulicatella sp. TaxID=316089 RepID=UPI0028EDDEC5|nr:TlpA disulfide reductase family protein [uncultured Granulicatella sp.]
MKNYKKILTHSILFGSLFVLAAGCQTTSTTTNTSTTTATTTTSKEKTTTDLIRQVLPNFTFETADTQQKTPADFKGKKIVYVAWASWCPNCQQELPILNELRKEYQDSIEFVLVNLLVKGETPEKAQAFLKEKGLAFNYYSDKEKSFQKALEIHSIPTMIFVDQEGKIKNVIDEVKDKATIEEVLKGL